MSPADEYNKDQVPAGKDRSQANPQGGKNANSDGSGVPDNHAGSGDSRVGKISLPVGGGAIRGIGEKFEANPVTGTASFSVPLAMSEGRGGFTPQLALSYDSGSGNSAFGLGWSVGLPSITRKTDKGLPQYIDNPDCESDVFILSGAEDLVPLLNTDGTRRHREEENYDIYAYRPRVEGLFASVERWVDKDSKISHWRSVSKDNILTIYGYSPDARIADPDRPKKVFSWLIEESVDAKGNDMLFVYQPEDKENIPESCYESPRLRKNLFANVYLKQVLYGNKAQQTNYKRQQTTRWEIPAADNFHFKLELNYGEAEDQTWLCRKDPFSNYRAGFEIRTYRLCRKIEMYHQFSELGQGWTLTKATELTYDEDKAFSLLKEIKHVGYQDTESDFLPPLTFSYTEAKPAACFKTVSEENLRNLPIGVDEQNYQWTDLYSEGISGIISMKDQAWYFMPNYGDKRYTHPEQELAEPVFGSMKREVVKPAAVNNQAESFQLGDVNSDGLPELIIQGTAIHGFYSRDVDGKWLNFRNFEHYPNINTDDANLRFMDLSGDGLTDIVISKGNVFDIYFSEGKQGYGNYKRITCSNEAGNAPKILFSDSKRRIFLADMSGDGLTDIVRITNQSIVYYPNMGYGRFGEEVVMSNPPLLDNADRWDARHVFLADVDGTGTTDLLYISKDNIKYYKNLSGNAWEEVTDLPPAIACNHSQQTNIQLTDLLGNGTQCLVVSSNLPTQSKTMRYWELTNGIKPFLLQEINNNMGGITRMYYASSTKFYIQDKLSGKPWITRLPFPVHVLEKVEIADLVAETLFTNRYAYHHGYYDHTEREFRGFGMVEQWDAEDFMLRNSAYSAGNNSLRDSVENNLQPPVYTKTWFHTGFFRGRNRISRLYEEEYYQGDTEA
ncbi:MAG: hypothetical protein LBI60_00555, partial [Bacteroidales bacterium]|nr:hypothetical protein [Bacteroidales bacterium]